MLYSTPVNRRPIIAALRQKTGPGRPLAPSGATMVWDNDTHGSLMHGLQ